MASQNTSSSELPRKGLVLRKRLHSSSTKQDRAARKRVYEDIGINVYRSANSLNIVLDLRNYQSKPEIDETIFGEEDIFTRQFFAMSF